MDTNHRMDPRDALNETLKIYRIKAADISEKSGISAEEISRYRKKRKDMNSLNLQKITNTLPGPARFYFYSLMASNGCEPKGETDNAKPEPG